MRKFAICALSLAVLVSGCDRGPSADSKSDAATSEPAKANTRPVELKTVTNSIGVKFVLIPAGEFMMGSPKGTRGDYPDELQHRVRITKPFYMGVYEVTQAQYKRVMGAKPSRCEGDANCPVYWVSWFDAAEFCRRLSNLPDERAAGAAYRLPTEAEWEYACRAGTTTKYSFGDDPARLEEYAWCHRNASGKPGAVGQKKPNAWGLYDMHGNVEEWCMDWFSKDYYGKSSVDDPSGPDSGEERSLRGGCYSVSPASWDPEASACYLCAARNRLSPDRRFGTVGFRVVRTAPPTRPQSGKPEPRR